MSPWNPLIVVVLLLLQDPLCGVAQFVGTHGLSQQRHVAVPRQLLVKVRGDVRGKDQDRHYPLLLAELLDQACTVTVGKKSKWVVN